MAAAQPVPRSFDFVPQVPILNPKVRTKIAKIFGDYFSSEDIPLPSRKDLASRKWCIITLMRMAAFPREDIKDFLGAIAAYRLALYLIQRENPISGLPDLAKVVHALNTEGASGDLLEQHRISAVIHLEEAMQLGGLLDSDFLVDVEMARHYLSTLATIQDEQISIAALEALQYLLASKVGIRKESERLNDCMEIIIGLIRGDHGLMTLLKLEKCLEVCAVILERWSLLYIEQNSREYNFFEEYELRRLEQCFKQIYNSHKPLVAIVYWAAFALERFKHIRDDTPLTRIFQSVVLNSNDSSAAARFEARGYKIKYETEKECLEFLLSKLEASKLDVKALEALQDTMEIEIDKLASPTCACFCIHILSEIILGSEDLQIQTAAISGKDSISLEFFFNTITGNIYKNCLGESRRLGSFFAKYRDKLPQSMGRSDLWTHPSLLLSLATCLQNLRQRTKGKIRDEANRLYADIENMIVIDQRKIVRRMYESRLEDVVICLKYCTVLDKALQSLISENGRLQALEDADKNSLRKFNELKESRSDFVGREVELQKLSKAFFIEEDDYSGPQSFPLRVRSLCGRPGIGKSETALQFANSHKGSFEFVWVIDCTSSQTFERSLRLLPRGFDLHEVSREDFEAFKKRVHEHLESGFFKLPWLAIYDNYNGKKEELDLPKRGGCAVVTTQLTDFFQDPDHNITLNPFNPLESRQLLNHHRIRGEEKDISQLVDILGSSPLVLSQVATTFDRSLRMTAKKYLDKLQKQVDERKLDPATFSNNILAALEAIWPMTKDTLWDKEIAWLQYCASSEVDPVPVDLIDPWLKSRGVKEEFWLELGDRIIKNLVEASMMQHHGGYLYLHPIQKTVILHDVKQSVFSAHKKFPVFLFNSKVVRATRIPPLRLGGIYGRVVMEQGLSTQEGAKHAPEDLSNDFPRRGRRRVTHSIPSNFGPDMDLITPSNDEMVFKVREQFTNEAIEKCDRNTISRTAAKQPIVKQRFAVDTSETVNEPFLEATCLPKGFDSPTATRREYQICNPISINFQEDAQRLVERVRKLEFRLKAEETSPYCIAGAGRAPLSTPAPPPGEFLELCQRQGSSVRKSQESPNRDDLESIVQKVASLPYPQLRENNSGHVTGGPNPQTNPESIYPYSMEL